ncbi:MAG: Gfo/Idh/MocA family oxidoreductase [Alphaproteobacteria bacterium]
MPDSGSLTRTRTLRAGVVGAGVFGGYHAQKYAGLPGVRLAAICDASQLAAEATAARFGAQSLTSLSEFARSVDVATIATPASTHYAVARQLIDAGVHVLVEKPLALSLADADDLISRARLRGATLQVGHQERFVLAATGLLGRRKTPRAIHSRRAGPWTGRCTDVGVVIDLMIHDLDLVHQLVAAPLVAVQAEGRRVHGEDADEVSAELTFGGGTQVYLYASRISDVRERTMRLDYDDGSVEIDFGRRTLLNTTPAHLTPPGDGDAVQRAIAADPLGYAVGEFVKAVREGREPFVNGHGARRALASALRILEAAEDRVAA